jgi:ElaB/YqjD/DUF883 family membrane-anchored ribosome-binding protein
LVFQKAIPAVRAFAGIASHFSFPVRSIAMLTSNIKTARTDLKSLLRDAQELFREATLSTGDKADDLRGRGLVMLEAAMSKAQDVQTVALEKGKEVALTTDEFVHQNPWKAVAIASGVGLLVGMLIARK